MFYQILPYLEQQNAIQGGNGLVTSVAVPEYYCPTRRAAVKRDSGTGALLGLNDYAIPLWKNTSDGAWLGGSSPGCWNVWGDAAGG
jgi:hypothetical protein